MFLQFNMDNFNRAEKQQAQALNIKLDKEKADLDYFRSLKKSAYDKALSLGNAKALQNIANAKNSEELGIANNELFDTTALSVGVDPKVLSTPDYKTIQGLAPAMKAIQDYKTAVNKWGSQEKLSAVGSGELKSAYGDAISAWKTLAQLGALSGADFGLAENVIPKPSFWTRNAKVITQLDGTMSRATTNIGNLTKNLKLAFPESAGGIDAIMFNAVNPDSSASDPLGLEIISGTSDPLGLGAALSTY